MVCTRSCAEFIFDIIRKRDGESNILLMFSRIDDLFLFEFIKPWFNELKPRGKIKELSNLSSKDILNHIERSER